MKKANLLLALPLIIAILFLISCEEVPVQINRGGGPGPTDTELENQLQNVLIEEYTGVACVNCPAGSALIETLLGIHGDRLVAVAIHGGQFAVPYPSSKEDLKTVDGERLINELLGEPQGYPAAVINRKVHPESFGLELVRDDWAGVINVQKALTPSVAIKVNTSFDPISRRLNLTTQILQKEMIDAQDIRLTLLITESKIIDTQLTPVGLIDDYEHNHVLREFVTPFNGTPIAGDLILDEKIELSNSIDIPDSWNIQNIEVVGIIHINDATIDVLQATKAKVEN